MFYQRNSNHSPGEINLNAEEIVFIDTEIDIHGEKILDIGAVKGNGQEFHARVQHGSLREFCGFLRGNTYICAHNILNHDLKYLDNQITEYNVLEIVQNKNAQRKSAHRLQDIYSVIDTLYLSPLLFPQKPYHHLVKDDKLAADELNNPLNDAKKARDLFHDEAAKFAELEEPLAEIYCALLSGRDEFKGFFQYIGCKKAQRNISGLILETFKDKICAHAPVGKLAEKHPTELCFALSQIHVIQYDSITPPWVLKNYPRVENVLHLLRSRKCASCAYCAESLDETRALSRFFHFDGFRRYNGKPLQKNAIQAAVANKSLLAIFPTGGGKSIAFQLPALMAGVNEKGLTVVISPLQSLMKDQTDNLEKQHNITEAVTINSSLDPLEKYVQKAGRAA
ncbi:MAG: DEAD/DEAH box helicase [Spirochaetota bacterium]|jgi:ATP-dependent DNA helicase RecQ|nr:DEAD/DEAH box helicase [Spirochaetota bacterium]